MWNRDTAEIWEKVFFCLRDCPNHWETEKEEVVRSSWLQKWLGNTTKICQDSEAEERTALLGAGERWVTGSIGPYLLF